MKHRWQGIQATTYLLWHSSLKALIKDQFTHNTFKCIRRDGIMLDQLGYILFLPSFNHLSNVNVDIKALYNMHFTPFPLPSSSPTHPIPTSLLQPDTPHSHFPPPARHTPVRFHSLDEEQLQEVTTVVIGPTL
jgi:hypothetical protein